MKIYIVSIILILSFISCNKEVEKQYNLAQIDAYSFRRNYFGSDTLTGKALDSFMHRNPTQNLDYKTRKGKFYEQLTTHGIINDGTLVLKKFDTLPDTFDYKTATKNLKLHIAFPDTFEIPARILYFYDHKTKIHVDTIFYDDPTIVSFTTMDLDGNGTDELYTLFEWYAVNGHNYELGIYELTEK